MRKSSKRKQQVQLKPETEKSARTGDGRLNQQEPYPAHPGPTPEECRAVRDSLLALHGFPQEFAKYRRQRPNLLSHDNDESKSSPIMNGDSGGGSGGEPESVLDGLVKTVLSQNTTEVNSSRAFANLKDAYPTWEDVLVADAKNIENAIRCGGLAPTKASCIKNILRSLLKKKGNLCLEYLRKLSVDEVKSELSHFKGIGPKTVACVLMFHLQQDDFPVDTHVFEIAKAIGWVPLAADRNKTYLHLNRRIPNELKFDLNCLLYTHGKLCSRCNKKGGNLKRKISSCEDSCPLLNHCDNTCLNMTDKID